MSEQTNQTTDTAEVNFEGMFQLDDDGVLIDDDAGETTPAAPAEEIPAPASEPDPAPAQEEKPETPPTATTTPQAFKVKYNGQERELTLDEAIVYAQKGMNYDHVKAERDEAMTAKKLIEDTAKSAGLSKDEFLQQLQAGIAQQRKNALSKQGIEGPAADQIVRAEQEKADLERQLAELKGQADSATAALAMQQRFSEFFKSHPDVDAKAIPQSVIDAISKGGDANAAYAVHERDLLKAELAKLQSELAAEKQNTKNRTTSPGSAAGTGAQKPENDPFLSGLRGL